MSNQAFDMDIRLGRERAPSEITDRFASEHYYQASLLQDGGVTPDTFVEFAGRFSLLCDQLYGGSSVSLVIDRAHPNITVDCEELVEALKEQPGDEIPTPANQEMFKLVFAKASTADLSLRPNADIPVMPSTVAKVSWERSAGRIMEFYAQSSDTAEGRDFIQELYARMFHVSESAPRKGIDVALGMFAVRDQRKKGMGATAFRQEMQERFDNNSAMTGHPNSTYLPGESPDSRLRNESLLELLRKIFGK